ncbi:hypothetical protein QYS48_13635 [Marivirga arenosa]|uniref:Uncharacterized protein n=1 Tax=Marivirga arenosa TaxID=3059076 RepID=A0AA49GGR3_9BACT|nr:hypothetical protein [Marivirga sp. ABR2-2]WKK87638.2 hypothetical protein QYS48_13635 [Marivirga sp. ABR2-2]
MTNHQPIQLTPTLSLHIDNAELRGVWVTFENKEGVKIAAFVDHISRTISSFTCKEPLDVMISLGHLIKNNEEDIYSYFESNSSELTRLARVSKLNNIS